MLWSIWCRSTLPDDREMTLSLRQCAIRGAKWLSIAGDILAGRRRGPRILIYHQVGSGSGLEMDVELDAFESQLDWMSDHGEIVSLDEAVNRIGDEDADHCFVLTFDDGHESLYQKAFPAMAERALPFLLYTTTAPLEGTQLLHDDPNMRLSSWDEIISMRESGLMMVGAHGHRHLDARDHDREVLDRDMRLCNDLIRKRLEVDPRHFAYPWGHRSDAAEPVVRELYETAAIGSGGDLRESTDVHRLPRIPVMLSDGSPSIFARKMWGGFRFETLLRSLRDRLRDN